MFAMHELAVTILNVDDVLSLVPAVRYCFFFPVFAVQSTTFTSFLHIIHILATCYFDLFYVRSPFFPGGFLVCLFLIRTCLHGAFSYRTVVETVQLSI